MSVSDDSNGDPSMIGVAVGVTLAVVVIIAIIVIIVLLLYKKRFDQYEFQLQFTLSVLVDFSAPHYQHNVTLPMVC